VGICVIYHSIERSELYQTLYIAFPGSELLFLKANNKKILSYFLSVFQPEVIQKESWILRRIFSICRAFKSQNTLVTWKPFFQKSQKPSNLRFLSDYFPITMSKIKSKTIFRFLVRRRIELC
jgi:hypothetical protein